MVSRDRREPVEQPVVAGDVVEEPGFSAMSSSRYAVTSSRSSASVSMRPAGDHGTAEGDVGRR